MTVEQEVEAFKRRLLDERLARLSQPQRDFFWRIWAYSPTPGMVPSDKLESAIDLCDRTIRKNEADPTRLVALEKEQGRGN